MSFTIVDDHRPESTSAHRADPSADKHTYWSALQIGPLICKDNAYEAHFHVFRVPQSGMTTVVKYSVYRVIKAAPG